MVPTDEDVLSYAVSKGLTPAQIFPRRTVQEVRCPLCHSDAGMPCTSRGRVRKSNHLERVSDRARLWLATPRQHRVFINFELLNGAWKVHFIEGDGHTPIGTKTRYMSFQTLDGLRAFFVRCTPEDSTLKRFDDSVRSCGRGSEYVLLTDEQYAKLRQTP
jgi:hypothetical protein